MNLEKIKEYLEENLLGKMPVVFSSIIILGFIFFISLTMFNEDKYIPNYYNYHTTMDMEVSSITLKEVGKIQDGVSFRFDNEVVAQDSNFNKVYIKIIDEKGKELYKGFLKEGINKVVINYTTGDFNNTKGWVIYYYLVEDSSQVDTQKEENASVIYKEDLLTGQPLDTFFDENLTYEEEKNQVIEIQKRFLNEENLIKYVPQYKSKIEKGLSKRYKKVHEDLEILLNKLKEKYEVWKQILIDSGVGEDEIQEIITSENTLDEKVQLLKDLKQTAEQSLLKSIDTLTKELMDKGEKLENIEEETKNLPPLEQKKYLEKELQSKG